MANSRKSARLAWLTIALCTTAPVILYLFYENRINAKLEPPKANCTLVELAKHVAPPNHLAEVKQNGQQRLVWVGTVPRYTLRSGPPCYVFDQRGRLIDWVAETGEGSELDEIVIDAYNGSTLTLEEAKQKFNG